MRSAVWRLPVPAFRLALVSVLALASVAAAVSCSENHSSVTTDPAGDEDAAGGGGGGGDGGRADGSVDDDASTDGGVLPSRAGGSVFVSQITINGAFSTQVGASFYPKPIATPSSACVTTTDGDCYATACTFADAGAPPDAGPAPNAGAIEVTGGLIAGGMALAPPYTTKLGTTKLFDEGDMLTVTAAGAPGSIGPFTRTVAAPAELVVAPAIGPTVARTAPFTVTWTSAGPGKVVSSVMTYSSTQSAIASCTVLATAKAMTVPPALLGKLLPGNGTVTLSPLHNETFAVGDYNMTFGLSRTPVTAQVTVQ